MTLAAAAIALAEPPQGKRQGVPMYDVNTEATLTGTIESVETVPPPGGGRGKGGTHVVLRSCEDTITVHLGPTAFLESQGISVASGDALEVVGSRVTMRGQAVVLARELKKAGTTYTLRDSAGRPLWSGGQR
jgi:hypothetical protein